MEYFSVEIVFFVYNINYKKKEVHKSIIGVKNLINYEYEKI